MSCYSPLQAFRGRRLANGKRAVVWRRQEAEASLVDKELRLPCGQCLGCRLERSRQWAMRCLDESRMHSENCFLTLTYDDSHLPPGGSFRKEDLQDFFKRFRRYLNREQYDRDGVLLPRKFRPLTEKVRYFACAEYGEKGRGHFHACVFGFDFLDKKLWSQRSVL